MFKLVIGCSCYRPMDFRIPSPQHRSKLSSSAMQELASKIAPSVHTRLSESVLRCLHLTINPRLPHLDINCMDWFRLIARLSKSFLDAIDEYIVKECLEFAYPEHDPRCCLCNIEIAGLVMVQAGNLLHFGCCKARLGMRCCQGAVAHATRYGRYGS